MIPAEHDSLILARRCIAARFHGTEAQLIDELGVAGINLTMADVEDTAQFMGEAFRVFDPTKSNCYLCTSPVAQGKLCSCFDEVTPKRHYNVNDPRILAKLPPDTRVETFCCRQCAALDHVTAAVALTSHARNGHYKTRLYCGACFAEKKKAPRSKRPRGGRHSNGPKTPEVGRIDLLAVAAASVSAGEA